MYVHCGPSDIYKNVSVLLNKQLLIDHLIAPGCVLGTKVIPLSNRYGLLCSLHSYGDQTENNFKL
jgi:hypothetical protein